MKIFIKNMLKNINEHYVYILIFFVFIGVNFLKFNINGINMNIGRILMLLTGLAILIIVIKNKNIKIVFTNNKFIKWSLIFFIIWSVYSLISIVMCKDINMFLINNFFLVAGTMSIFYLIYAIKEEKQITIIYRIIEVVMFINCLYTLYLKYKNIGQFGGFYYNNNDMATVLLLAIPVEIYLIYFCKKNFFMILRVAILLLYLITFMLLDSRANVIGLLIEIIVYFIGFIIIKKEKILKSKLLKYGLITCSIVILFVGCNIAVKEIGKISFKPNYTNLNSNNVRINLILNGLEFYKTSPFIGLGAGNLDYYLANNAIYPTNGITKMHNLYLEILVTYGIFIFIAYLIFYFGMCFKLLKAWLNSKINIGNKINILTLLVFWTNFAFSCISSSSNFSKEWLWVLIGITLASIKIIDNINLKIIKNVKHTRRKNEI